MTGVLTFTILIAIFSFAEIIAEKTKALLSTTLVLSTVLLIAFWLGLPADIFQTAAIDSIGMILVSFLITSMGTTLDFSSLKAQGKIIAFSITEVTIGVVLILLVGPFFIGKDLSIAGAPIFSGGNAAALIMKDILKAKGMEELYKFCILVLLTQNFLGVPIASVLLRKEAKTCLTNPNLMKTSYNFSNKTVEKRKLLELPESFTKPSVVFTKLALVSLLGHYIASFFNGKVHPFVILLLLGVLFSELGFLEHNALSKTNSEFFIVFTTTLVIFTSLANTSPGEIFNMIVPLVICLSIGIIGVLISGYLLSKIFKTSPYLTMAVGLTCTFGFPTTMLMPQEVASAIGKDQEEKQLLIDYLMPPMLTSGFATVTIFSVFITGFIINII